MENAPKSFLEHQSSYLDRAFRYIDTRLNNVIEVAKAISSPSAIKAVNLADGSVTQPKLAANVVGNGPVFRAHHHLAVAQSIPLGVGTKVQTIEEIDSNANYANDRFTPTVPGYYLINCTARYTFINNLAWTYVYKNGTSIVIHSQYFGQSYDTPIVTCSGIVFMNGTTDYLEWYCQSNVATTLDITVTPGNPWHWGGCLIRAA
jgi:hypothetical protein